MQVLRLSFRSAAGILAFSSFTMARPFAFANAAESSSAASACAFGGADAVLTCAVLAGVAAACAVLAAIFRDKAHLHAKHALRQKARLDALLTVESNFRALASLEPQAFVIWADSHPRLALYTLAGALGVPAKLPQLLRFGSWLHPDDAGLAAESLSRLQTRGEAFVANASTLEGHVIEIAGAVSSADTVLRIRPFSPVNKEVVRLIGENKRLKQSIQDRESLLDSLPIPVWLRDLKGALTWVNTAYVNAISAKSRDETIEKKIELFETRQRSDLLRLGQSKKPGRLKLQTIVNGGVQIYEAIAAPLDRGSGGAALDVAPLAIAKEELERQMAAHSRTLDKVSTGVAVFGGDRKLVYGNDAFARIWSMDNAWLGEKPSASEFLDQLRQRRLLPEQPDYRKWRDGKVLAWDRNRTIDELWHRPDGRTVHVVTDCRDDGGVTFLFDDVTEKLSLERQFHSLIEGQRETLDHLSEGIAVFGADGRLQLFNPAYQAIWRLPAEMLPASNRNGEFRAPRNDTPHFEDIRLASEASAPDPDFWRTLREAITGMPEARDTFSGTVARRDETHLAYAVTPLPDGGTLLTFADVTDRKRFEEVLLERNEALEASDRLKTAFLSHVSYELRTPLTTIIGFADLLAEPVTGTLNAKQREYLNDIKTSSQVLLNIINDILDLAVIDAGALDLKLAPVKVDDVIEAAELGVRERLSRAKVHLDVHIAKGAGTVMADSNRLIQVIYNLLSNAIGFSPEDGTITLTCRREKSGIAISVQDTGLGIPEEEQATVFERFESRSKGSRHRGAGLGLSLVKSIVQLHKGRIDLRSTPGAGTTVTVFLPDRHPALHQKDKNGNGKADRKALSA
jgi:signal transduction histidine kinase